MYGRGVRCAIGINWREDGSPEDVGVLGQVDSPFGLAAVALSGVFTHFPLLCCSFDVIFQFAEVAESE